MDPSAQLLGFLHRGEPQGPPASDSPISQPNSQPAASAQTQPQQQNSTSTALPFLPYVSQQFSGYIPGMAAPPAAPSLLPSQPQTVSPNPLASFFHPRPIPMAPPPPSNTSQPQPPTSNSSESNSPSTSPTPLNIDPTLNIDEEKTKSLKLAFFGRQPLSKTDERQVEQEQEHEDKQDQEQHEQEQEEQEEQENEGTERSATPPVPIELEEADATSVEKSTVEPPETVNVEERLTSPVEVIDYNTLSSLTTVKQTVPSTASSEKQSPTLPNKSMFTYTNPFDLLKKSPPSSSPGLEFANHPWAVSTSSPPPKKRELQSVQKEGGMFSRPQHQMEPFLSGLSAWNVRATSVPKTDLSPSDGVRLPLGDIVYSAAERNESVLCTKDLHLETITLIPSDLEYRVGKSIAINGQYICYTVKAGKVRVISSMYGSRTLLRNHEKPILDVCIQDSPQSELGHEPEKQLLLAVGADSKITVWELSEPPREQNVEIPHKMVLEIDGKTSADETKQGRYLRAVWHPINRHMFAVATDKNDVLVININKLLDGNETASFIEADITNKILKTEHHDEPINDLTFSSDGKILAAASYESVMFWELETKNDVVEHINPVRKIIMSREQVTSIFLVDPDELRTELPVTLQKYHYAIVGTDRNTTIHLYDIRAGKDVQTIKFLPPPARRPSLSKAYRKEEEMFNCIDYDQHTRTLVLANSARISIFALHLSAQKNKEGYDYTNKSDLTTGELIEAESSTSPEEFPTSQFSSAQFDYMIEYPINQLVGSFVLVPEKTPSDGFSFYCIQSKAVQQYHITRELLLPDNLDTSPLYENPPHHLMQVEQEEKGKKAVVEVDDKEEKKEENELGIGKSLDKSVKSDNSQNSTAEDNVVEKDFVKETVVVETIASTETTVTESNAFPPEEKMSSIETSFTIDSALGDSNVSEETELKGSEQHKSTTPGIRLSGPKVNGAIAKLKEKKKNLPQGESDSEKGLRRKDYRRPVDREKETLEGSGHSLESSNKSAGKKSAEGISLRNGKVSGSGEKTQKRSEEITGNRSTSGGKLFSSTKQQPLGNGGFETTGTHDGPQQATASTEVYSNNNNNNNLNLTRELKKIEDSLTNKISKMFTKEMDKQYQKLGEERIAHQAAETARQETILKVVSQTLSNNTSKLLDQTIRNEIQNAVIPTLNKMVANSVDKQVNRGIVEAINKSIPAAIDKTVTENVQRVLSKSTVIDSIAKGVSKSMRPIIDEIFRENFSNMLIPSYQNATTAMFEQIHRTFEAGLQQIAQKTAQSSLANSEVESNAIARLQASIDHLTLSMQQLQHVQQLQANMQANLISQLSGQHVDQQVGRTSNDLHQLRRSLSGELKRMLIPQGVVSSQTPTLAQESYSSSYVTSGRSTNTQQQQQQPQQQHSHQHHHQQRQVFSPVEPPGLTELKANVDRYLELGEYEEAFLKALASGELSIIIRLCSKVSPKTVFLPSRPLLSQPVILSLIHHLTMDSDLKFAWIEEALIHLNPKDISIREHCQRILQIAKQRLTDRYSQIITEDNQNPSLKTITVLIHVLNSLIREATQ